MKKSLSLFLLPLLLTACGIPSDKLYGTYKCTMDFKEAGKAVFNSNDTMTRYPVPGRKLKNNEGEDVDSRNFNVSFDKNTKEMFLVDPDNGRKSRMFIVSPDFSSYKASDTDYHCER